MITISSSFDDFGVQELRRIERAAAQSGPVWVDLPSDAALEAATGRAPKFPEAERRYLAEAVRWVAGVSVVDDWAADRAEEAFPSAGSPTKADEPPVQAGDIPHPIVFVTGCYDWLHSGHVRLFEEASAMGSLVATVGNDASVADYKGPGHPMFPANDRQFMVGAIRHVAACLIASGSGWLDAAPEMERLDADILVVNEDGDRPEKAAWCAAHGVEYRVLARAPRQGLQPRSSTSLRGY
jgi:cytidyltransferase-like protein